MILRNAPPLFPTIAPCPAPFPGRLELLRASSLGRFASIPRTTLRARTLPRNEPIFPTQASFLLSVCVNRADRSVTVLRVMFRRSSPYPLGHPARGRRTTVPSGTLSRNEPISPSNMPFYEQVTSIEPTVPEAFQRPFPMPPPRSLRPSGRSEGTHRSRRNAPTERTHFESLISLPENSLRQSTPPFPMRSRSRSVGEPSRTNPGFAPR